MNQNKKISLQAAANLLGCSLPHLVKLLEERTIPFTKVGVHKSVKLEDVMYYKKQQKEQQRQLLKEIMQEDEKTGLYDV